MKKNKKIKKTSETVSKKEVDPKPVDDDKTKASNKEIFEPNNEEKNSNKAPKTANNEEKTANNGKSEPNKCFLNGAPFEKKSIEKFPASIRKKIESDFFGEKEIDQNLCDEWNAKLNSFAIFKFSLTGE